MAAARHPVGQRLNGTAAMVSRVFKLFSAIADSDSAQSQLRRGSVVSFFIQGTGAGLIFLSEVLLARLLGARDYGLVATVAALLQVLTMVALLGSNNLLLRFVPVYRVRQDRAEMHALLRFCALLSIGIGLAIGAAIALAMLMAHQAVSAETRWTVTIGVAALPVMALSLQRQAVLRGLHLIARALLPDLVVRPLVLMALAIAWYMANEHAIGAPQAMGVHVAAAIVALLLGRSWMNKALPADIRTSGAAAPDRQWLRIAVPLFLIAVMQLLIVRLDIMLLGLMVAPEAAGRYAAASRVADLAVFALAAANVAVAPLIAAMHARDDMVGLQRLLATLAKGVLLVTIPLIATIMFFGTAILNVFGPDYDSAYTALVILVCGQAINALSGPVDFMLTMTGQQLKMLRILVASAVLNVVLNLSLIPTFGMEGAAFATACTTVAWNLLMRRAVLSHLGVDASLLALFRRRRAGAV